MPRLDECRTSLLEAIFDYYDASRPGPSIPADISQPFESVVRAGLFRVAEPRLASDAFEVLRGAGLLEAPALASADPAEIDDLFRSARIRLDSKAVRPLQRIARWAADHEFDADRAGALTTELLREEWRALNGVGPSTADSLLLHGLGRPTYPVDRATYRILVRHGWLEPSADYDEARSVAEGIAPDDPEGLARLAFAFGRLGRECCKPSVARCDRCPLRPMLPPGGPVEVGE